MCHQIQVPKYPISGSQQNYFPRGKWNIRKIPTYISIINAFSIRDEIPCSQPQFWGKGILGSTEQIWGNGAAAAYVTKMIAAKNGVRFFFFLGGGRKNLAGSCPMPPWLHVL